MPGSPLFYHLTYLEMWYPKICSEGFQSLSFPSLRSLSLYDCFSRRSSVAGLQQAAVALGNLPCLQELVLSTDDVIFNDPLYELLKSDCMPRLKVLNLNPSRKGWCSSQCVAVIGDRCPQLRVLMIGLNSDKLLEYFLSSLVRCGGEGKLPLLEGLGIGNELNMATLHRLRAVWPALQLCSKRENGGAYYGRHSIPWTSLGLSKD